MKTECSGVRREQTERDRLKQLLCSGPVALLHRPSVGTLIGWERGEGHHFETVVRRN